MIQITFPGLINSVFKKKAVKLTLNERYNDTEWSKVISHYNNF